MSGDVCVVENSGGGSQETRNVPDTMRSASSIHDNDIIGSGHGQGRLDSPQAWSTKNNTVGEWYQIDKGKIANISGVVIQGRADNDQRVTTFRVKYRGSSETWNSVDGDAIFTGNTDRDTKVEVQFASPVNARYIRIYPETWNGHMSLRAGIISDSTNADQTVTLASVPDTMRSASSVWSGEEIGVGHGRGQLNSPQAWSTQNNTVGEWYEMETDSVTSIKGVAIKGRADTDQRVNTFKVQYIDASGSWVDVNNGQIFEGNYDKNSLNYVFFDIPINTSFIRLYPQTWTVHMSLRADLLK
jgi:hypothetical protein